MDNRLKKILDMIISPTQAAFIPGRQITDNVIVGFECIHAINNRRKGKVGQVAMKLDMSKAYDKVEWSFLRRIMDKMDFSSKWIEGIMNCIQSVEHAVLINGIPQEEFRLSRGLRQGDPLSPYIHFPYM